MKREVKLNHLRAENDEREIQELSEMNRTKVNTKSRKVLKQIQELQSGLVANPNAESKNKNRKLALDRLADGKPSSLSRYEINAKLREKEECHKKKESWELEYTLGSRNERMVDLR